jgi:hypothetical protein
MYARIRKNGKTYNKSVLACHNIRIDGKPHPIIVKTFGHSSDEDVLQTLLNEAKEWIYHNKDEWLQSHLSLKKTIMSDKKKISVFSLQEEKRINVGMEDIFGFLYEKLGFNLLLSSTHQKTLRNVLLARILEPGSKRQLSQTVEKRFDSDLPIDRIYRMMDCLNNESDSVEKKIFEATKKSCNNKVSVVLFDVTTLSFESISEDELRAFGFSKDFKFNTTQITLALATTKDGLPIGYKLFPGNTAESKTLIESIRAWRKTFEIEKVTIIGDRAMMSENNLSNLEEAKFKYIVAYPLRKLSKRYKEQILNENNYCKISGDKEINRYHIIDLGGRKLFISYSQKRADKDAKDRERLVNKLNKKLATCKDVKRLLNKNGYLKYSNVSGQAVACIDMNKIAEDARWDGLHGIITNEDDCDESVFDKYRRLWVIEESFRINKHTLKMRPIYHFTPERIKAHILLCFMAFALVRHAQYKLTNAGNAMSSGRIIDALREVQASILVNVINEEKYKMLSKLSDDAKAIYDAFNIKTTGLSVIRLAQ